MFMILLLSWVEHLLDLDRSLDEVSWVVMEVEGVEPPLDLDGSLVWVSWVTHELVKS